MSFLTMPSRCFALTPKHDPVWLYCFKYIFHVDRRSDGGIQNSSVCNLFWGQESQLKALKDTVHICFSAVLHNQPSSSHRFPTSPTHLFRYSSLINSSRVTFQQPHAKVIHFSAQLRLI